MIFSCITLLVQGANMTKKTRNFLLSVFEYCIRAMFLAKNEGILALENLFHGCALTKTGKKLFDKKVDIFIARLLCFIVDAGYTTEGNQEFLKSISLWAGKKTKTALKIASTCMDYLANGNKIDAILLLVYAYVGEKNYEEFLGLYKKIERDNKR